MDEALAECGFRREIPGAGRDATVARAENRADSGAIHAAQAAGARFDAAGACGVAPSGNAAATGGGATTAAVIGACRDRCGG